MICCCVWPDSELKLRLPGSVAAQAPCQHGGAPRGLRGGGGPTPARRLRLELGRILWRRRGEARLPPLRAWPSAPPVSRSLRRPRREFSSLLVAGTKQSQRPAEGVVAGGLELCSLLQQNDPTPGRGSALEVPGAVASKCSGSLGGGAWEPETRWRGGVLESSLGSGDDLLYSGIVPAPPHRSETHTSTFAR
jgi:hypothetical protein